MMKYILVLVGIIIGFLFSLFLRPKVPKIENKVVKPEFVPIPIITPTKPKTITVFEKPDTVFREKVVKGDIVVQTQYRDRYLDVTTINTRGIMEQKEYKLPALWYTATVDYEGKVKVKRKILPRVIAGISIAAVGGITFFLNKKKKKL
jgi:hypothetical protein